MRKIDIITYACSVGLLYYALCLFCILWQINVKLLI